MYASSLPLLNSGNNAVPSRQAGAYRVGRTRQPHFLLNIGLNRRSHVAVAVKLLSYRYHHRDHYHRHHRRHRRRRHFH